MLGILILVVAIVMIGCTTGYAKLADKDNQEYEEQKEEKRIPFEKTKEYKDWEERRDEYAVFLDEVADLEEKYVEDINDLVEKFNKTENLDKKEAYNELMLESWENFYDEFNDIYAPECAKDAYNYYLSHLTKEKLQCKAFKKNESDWDKYSQ